MRGAAARPDRSVRGLVLRTEFLRGKWPSAVELQNYKCKVQSAIAQPALPATAWIPLERLARYKVATEPRCKPERIKEAIVRFKGYLNKELVTESVAEFSYQPNKCGRSHRLVVGRKNITVQKGETVLFEDIKYFFYITNHTAYSAERIVALANGRCDQENVIKQLKNGVNVMRTPVDDLLSNGLYGDECLGLES
jgi:hypothetical protein